MSNEAPALKYPNASTRLSTLFRPEEYAWIGEGMEAIRWDFLPEGLERELRAAGTDVAIGVQGRRGLEERSWLGDARASLTNGPRGSVTGRRARGVLTVDIQWSGGKPIEATLRPALSGEHFLRPAPAKSATGAAR